jgi:hypothetical protein
MLGAFAEFDRAKITERMTRGRLHRLRMGELSSTGHRIYGYHYVKKTPDAPAWLVINEEQAAIVRSIFEMFASGNYGILNISRFIERFRPARDGRNGTEARSSFHAQKRNVCGTRYYNGITAATDANRINNIFVGFQTCLALGLELPLRPILPIGSERGRGRLTTQRPTGCFFCHSRN